MERGAPRKLGEGPSGPRADAGTGQRQLLGRGERREGSEEAGAGPAGPEGTDAGRPRASSLSIRPEQRVSSGASGSS